MWVTVCACQLVGADVWVKETAAVKKHHIQPCITTVTIEMQALFRALQHLIHTLQANS